MPLEEIRDLLKARAGWSPPACFPRRGAGAIGA
jgi:hypothetical protein